ncbi:MAG: hypothetical protein ABFC88_14805 [Thermoguttaceae bacterium]
MTPQEQIISALRDTLPHLRHVERLAGDDTRLAVGRYVTRILDAQIDLRRELREGVRQ